MTDKKGKPTTINCKKGNHPPISICEQCPLFKKDCPVEVK